MAGDLTTKNQGRVPSRYGDPSQSFRTEMDRLFDSFLGGAPAMGGLRQGFAAGLTPSLDAKETDSEVVAQTSPASKRGTSEKKSERNDERDSYHVMERSYGSFQRMIRLPEAVDEDKPQARFDKGVLTITLPKRPEAASGQKRIEIKSA